MRMRVLAAASWTNAGLDRVLFATVEDGLKAGILGPGRVAIARYFHWRSELRRRQQQRRDLEWAGRCEASNAARCDTPPFGPKLSCSIELWSF
jgi:hypothetical protein